MERSNIRTFLNCSFSGAIFTFVSVRCGAEIIIRSAVSVSAIDHYRAEMRLRWLFLAIFTAAPTLAVSPPPLPGWTHVGTFASDSAERHGVYSPGGPIVYSSAVVGELDGITANGKEVVVASADGTVTTYSAAGVLL